MRQGILGIFNSGILKITSLKSGSQRVLESGFLKSGSESYRGNIVSGLTSDLFNLDAKYSHIQRTFRRNA